MRVRDAQYEITKPDTYSPFFDDLDQMVRFTGFPVVVGIHGDYGTGKTRMLKGLRECARSKGLPTTWLNTSDYDTEQHDLLRALLLRMGQTYLESHATQEKRANFFGVVAGSLDAGLAFCGKKGGILAAYEAIQKSTEAEKRDLLGEWANYGDPVQLYKEQFADLAERVCLGPELVTDTKTWFVFLDDLDRLFPSDALRLVQSLRGIIGGPPEIDNDKRPRVVFLIALNMDCLRAAIKQRYAETYGPTGRLDEFVEQYLRKLFLMGPRVPKLRDSGLLDGNYIIDESVQSSVDITLLRPALELCEKADLPHRAVLLALDRAQIQYLRRIGDEVPHNLCFAVFSLELARILREPEVERYLDDPQAWGYSADGFIGFCERLEPLNRFATQLSRLLKNPAGKDLDFVTDQSIWTEAASLCR